MKWFKTINSCFYFSQKISITKKGASLKVPLCFCVLKTIPIAFNAFNDVDPLKIQYQLNDFLNSIGETRVLVLKSLLKDWECPKPSS